MTLWDFALAAATGGGLVKAIDFARDLLRGRRQDRTLAARADAAQSTASSVALQLLADEVKDLRRVQAEEREECRETVAALRSDVDEMRSERDECRRNTDALRSDVEELRERGADCEKGRAELERQVQKQGGEINRLSNLLRQ